MNKEKNEAPKNKTNAPNTENCMHIFAHKQQKEIHNTAHNILKPIGKADQEEWGQNIKSPKQQLK